MRTLPCIPNNVIKVYVFDTVQELREWEGEPGSQEKSSDPIRKPGRPPRTAAQPGKEISTAPITAQQIDKIKEMSERGANIGEIALNLGIPENIVKEYW